MRSGADLLTAVVASALRSTKRLHWDAIAERLRRQRDLVEAALASGHLHWRRLPEELKEDAKLATVALGKKRELHERDYDVVSWSDLAEALRRLADRHPEMVLTALRNMRIAWEDVPDRLKYHHREISVIGVSRRFVQAPECPCLERETLKWAVEERNLEWARLPEALQTDLDFALSLSRLGSYNMVNSILEKLPMLRRNQIFLRRVIDTSKINLKKVFLHIAAPEMRSVYQLMLHACHRLPSLLRAVVGDSLQSNGQFLADLLHFNPAALADMPRETQMRFPELTEDV